MNKRVSVIIAVYNGEEYIYECITSLLEQSYQNIEIILVDDGSTDHSFSICNELAMQNELIKFFQKPNEGSGTARNLGLEHAEGDYIIFVDADDLCDKDYIKLLVSEMDKGVDVAICGYDRFDKTGTKEVRVIEKKKLTGKEIIEHTFASNNISGAVWNKMLKREVLVKNNIRFRKGIFKSEDMLLISEYYIYCNSFSYIPQALYHYRLNPLSKTQEVFADQKYDCRKDSMLDVGERIYDLYKEESSFVNAIGEYRLVRCCLWVILQWIQSGYYDRKNIKRIKNDIKKGWKGYVSLNYSTIFQKIIASIMCISPGMVYIAGAFVKMMFPNSLMVVKRRKCNKEFHKSG